MMQKFFNLCQNKLKNILLANETEKQKTLALMVFLAAVVFYGWCLIFLASRTYPYVGHDFRYFIPRLVDAFLHFKINGLSIQWYTPTFGSGMPAYPNPQDMQFSLPEFFMLFLNPWQATLGASVVYILIGSISAYLLLENCLHFSPFSSVIGSLLFNTSGFLLMHTIVGHVNFQTFPLLPLILLIVFHPKVPTLLKSCFLAIIFWLNFNDGGFYVLVISGFSSIITIPLIKLLNENIFRQVQVGRLVIYSALITAGLSGSKLFATFSMMRWFSRTIADHYPLDFWRNLTSIALQFFGTTLVIPSLSVLQLDKVAYLKYLEPLLERYQIWEFDTGVSPIILALIPLGVGIALSQNKVKLTKEKLIWLILLIASVWITIEFRLTGGLVYPLLQNLPILKSLHVNTRYLSAFLFPLAIITTWAMEQIFQKTPRQAKNIFLTLTLVVMMTPVLYFVYPTDYFIYAFDIAPSIDVYQAIQHGERFPIEKNLRGLGLGGGDPFLLHASDLDLHDPIYGYYLEDYHPQTHPGSAMEAENGYLNFTNPASLVFPEESGLTSFERFKVSEKDQVIELLNHRQPDLPRPILQKVLDVCMAITWIIILLVFLGFAVLKITGKRENNHQE